MVNRIKGFLKIDKYTTGKLIFIKTFPYTLNDVNQSMSGWVMFTETKLPYIYKILIIKKIRREYITFSKIFSILDRREMGR